MKKDQKQEVVSALEALLSALDKMAAEHEDISALYSELLTSLPQTILVDDDVLSKNVFIQGTTELYTDQEFQILSDTKKKNRTLAFTFLAERARVNKGFYDGPELFTGTWLETLEYIIQQVYKSNLRAGLTEEQKEAFRQLIRQLKNKS
ncbi:MAG: hypothetical protein WC453_04110 [Patescibacteria group bacterium]